MGSAAAIVPLKRPVRRVELIRVSGQGQADAGTPQDQVADLARLAARLPDTVLVERIDYGAHTAISAALDASERADLRRLFQLCRDRAFDELWVRAVNRLTRHGSMSERGLIWDMVVQAGALIRTTDGKVFDSKDPNAEVLWYLESRAAAADRVDIVTKTQAGRARAAAEGRWQGRSPYARRWSRVTRSWDLDPAQMEAYRLIFQLVLAGWSAARICERFTEEGRPPPSTGKDKKRGARWHPSVISKLVKTPGAVGKLRCFGHDFACPAVVDEQTWRLAQAALVNNRTASGARPSKFALVRKLLRCATCGAPMWTAGTGSKAPDEFYYRCSSAAKDPGGSHEGCRSWWRVSVVDAAVVDALRARLNDPTTLLEADTEGDAKGQDPEAAAKAARRLLARLETEELNLERQLMRGQLREKIADRLRQENAERRAEAEAQLAMAEAQLAAAQLAKDSAADLAARIEVLTAGVMAQPPAAWAQLVHDLFPKRPDVYLRIHGDGLIEGRGLVSLTASVPTGSADPSPARRSRA
jgi:DNA invertase Pin-like site-specific DNA recombinase